MCGVQAVTAMPSATAARAIASEISRSDAPSSMSGSRWQVNHGRGRAGRRAAAIVVSMGMEGGNGRKSKQGRCFRNYTRAAPFLPDERTCPRDPRDRNRHG